MKFIIFYLLCLMGCCAGQSDSNKTVELPKLMIDPAPADMARAPIEVQVRQRDAGEWQSLFVYHADSMSKQVHDHGGAEGFVKFAFSGEIEVRITTPAPVVQALVRPSMREPIPAEVSGRTVNFRMTRPRYVVVEINRTPPGGPPVPRFMLYLMADAPEENPPRLEDASVKVLAAGHHLLTDFQPGDRQVLYLASGVHTVEGDVAPLHSGKTLYLSSGAILRAKVLGDEVRDAKLLGRGILDGSRMPRIPGDRRSEGEQGFVFLRRGSHITIDGPVIYDCPYWNIVAFGTSDLTIRNHKAITWKLNNDGVQPRSCTDLLVEKSFFKCADDCIAVKTRRAAAMESRRLMFRDLVLWNDLPGNAMEIGHTSQADLLEDVTFQDIEVIHGEGGNHTISMCIIDHSTVRNVLFENIHVEGTKDQDIGLRVTTSRYTTDEQRGRIQGVTIRNYFSDAEPQGSEISGYNDDHLVENVLIENFIAFSNDPKRRQVILNPDALRLKTRFARNIRLEQP